MTTRLSLVIVALVMMSAAVSAQVGTGTYTEGVTQGVRKQVLVHHNRPRTTDGHTLVGQPTGRSLHAARVHADDRHR